MIISLAGYMGCGKTHISKTLSSRLAYRLVDLDKEISAQVGLSIPEIFSQKGELYFRKCERDILQEILESPHDTVLSLGGGTPAYFDNMDLINSKTTSFYLRASVGTLAERLTRQKAKRPLIARLSDEELPEFIAKHLFERNAFYSQCKFIVDTDQKTPEEICSEIIRNLPAEN